MTLPWRNGRVVSVGECMVELARGPDGRFSLGYGGDTFNTAVYLARAGAEVAYATALGDDPYSAGIIAMAKRENVETDLVATVPGRLAGLYLIETSPEGERSFWYWRDRAPARELFEGAEADRIADGLRRASLVYFSGVTLSLYSARGLDRLAAALEAAKGAGARVAMDSNYRPRGWGGDHERVGRTLERFWRLADIALPTLEDEQALWGDTGAEATSQRLHGLGIPEVVVKMGAAGAYVSYGGEQRHVPARSAIVPVDTTAAGDSFNAAYVAARKSGVPPAEAADCGNRLAAVVIQHRGAIVPTDATAAVLGKSSGQVLE
ncbi:MAG: sugar kinase [Hyphomicrobiaceae bacterium]|nr:sugar kinase [Hyphomicrobiaceae bacterium]